MGWTVSWRNRFFILFKDYAITGKRDGNMMKIMFRKILASVLATTVGITMCFGGAILGLENTSEVMATDGITGQNSVIITGTGIIGDDGYTEESITKEKTYTMDELKALGEETHLYSAYNNELYKSIQKATGVKLSDILENCDVSIGTDEILTIKAKDGKKVTFNPAVKEERGNFERQPGANQENADPKGLAGIYQDRYFFEYYKTGPSKSDVAFRGERTTVPIMFAWAYSDKNDNFDIDNVEAKDLDGNLKMVFGQTTPNDNNQPNWNGKTETLQIIRGDELPSNIEIGTNAYKYNRAAIMSESYVIKPVTYQKGDTTVTEYVKGTSLEPMIQFCGSDAIMCVSDADGNVLKHISMAEVISKNYMVVYETGEDADSMKPVLDKTDAGTTCCYRLYADGQEPLYCVGSIIKHNYSHVKKAAGNLSNGYEYDLCSVCNQKLYYKTLIGYSTYYVKSFKVSKGIKCFTAKWKKQSSKNRKNFKGYQVRYSTSSSMADAKYKTAGNKSTSKKVKGLLKKKTYYVQVRTYVYKNGCTFYSKWSAKKKVTTK